MKKTVLSKINFSKFTALVFAVTLCFFAIEQTEKASAKSLSEPIIINHNHTDISQIPQEWINKAKSDYRMSYGHTSHGSQIISGMSHLKGSSGSLYWFDSSGSGGGLSLHDRTPSGDLGNPDRTTWAARTRTMLDKSSNDRNIVMWSWCGQANTTEANMQTYLNLMNQLEADYPEVTFIYMTGHLNGTGESGNLNLRNNQIRDYCQANNKILFDFADIESYDPDGNYFLNLNASDSCSYKGGNWANEWCAANPGECSSISCAHSKSINCQMKGKAFWWMMARIAGWQEGSTTSVPANELKEGDLIKAANGYKVYIINGNSYKRHIFNPTIFEMYGHLKWHNIKSVSQETLDSFVTSDLYRAEGDAKIYFLEEVDEVKEIARKRHLKMTSGQFLSKGYHWEQVFIVSAQERDFYQTGEDMIE
ncbi:MAG: hypothetical protein U9N04_00070 [Patescibacteria group bacterium]|nr:hypothetical protein [Patescibacteria group bacterium]